MRIVLTTFGSLGDLHPYLAVGLGLQARGHEVVLATSEFYRAKVEGAGLAFHPVRPRIEKWIDNPDVIRRALDRRTGSEYLVRTLLLPYLEQSYEDLHAACEGADLLVTHALAFAAPLVAETLHMPWVSVALQPQIFFSTYDRPVLAWPPWLHHLRGLGRWPYRVLFHVARRKTAAWAAPIHQLRARLGLPAGRRSLVEGIFSPYGTLAWFSPLFASPQPDWPPRTQLTGFPFYDRPADALDPTLPAFLKRVDPPIVFTLGSGAVLQAGRFYHESLRAAVQLGRPAVLLVGPVPDNCPSEPLPPYVQVAEYAPYSWLLPRAAAVVHPGGIGTTAQALRTGCPMLVVPWSYDQFDNAERVRALGVARTLSRGRYTAARVARALKRLLSDRDTAVRVRDLAERLGKEDGVGTACRVLEDLLRDARNGSSPQNRCSS